MACLDTTLLLDVYGKRGRRAAARAAALLADIQAREEPVVTTRFTVAELYVGLERSRDPETEARLIELIVEEFEVLEFDEAAARHFGRRSKGTFTIDIANVPFDRDRMSPLIAIANVPFDRERLRISLRPSQMASHKEVIRDLLHTIVTEYSAS